MSEQPVLDVRGLTVEIMRGGDRPRAVDEVSFTVRRSEIVCLVGEHLRTDPTLFARAVTSLQDVPLRLVSQAASRRNITFVLRDADVPAAMNHLHDQFFAARVV